ncbi:hypothetical protein LCGC14_1836790 [marine sediment metagenome]|uniref:NAD-dependent epimerase/dehydratase domain-containing protein n=1 Tax=marine sediment metagenome TaxID=412755 RepID=A0A0F9H2I5_9ZZZZ
MKYLITGGSGYIGSRLTELLAERDDTEQVVISDLRPPRAPYPKTTYVEMDVRDPGMRTLLETEKPDVLIHLAFVLNPMHDEKKMYDIDVNGTQNVLHAATLAGTKHLLVTSSTTAYGAWPDNPVPMSEEHPVRGMPGYAYARDKTEIDRMCQLWAARHDDRTMTIVRPCIVFGPTVDNYLIRLWTNTPFTPIIKGVDAELQFVHEDDVVDALSRLVTERKPGIFNVTGDGTIKIAEAAALAPSGEAGQVEAEPRHRFFLRVESQDAPGRAAAVNQSVGPEDQLRLVCNNRKPSPVERIGALVRGDDWAPLGTSDGVDDSGPDAEAVGSALESTQGA